MAYQFSPSTGCFYPDHIDYPEGAIPADVIKATEEEFAAAMARQALDTLIVENDKVVVVTHVGPTLDEVKALRIGELRRAYAKAVQSGVAYTTRASHAAQFDPATLGDVTQAFAAGPNAWTADIWLDIAGQPVAPFGFDDVAGLREAMLAHQPPRLTELLNAVSGVHHATSIEAARAVTR